MAKKISQLTQATQVKSDDVTVIVQDGETKKLPLNMMVTKQDIENKKVAGLAKLDEIEATYENDTYTPTITVKNKSSVKVGEGDGVDYSANVMDGPAKSAILMGNTDYKSVDWITNFHYQHGIGIRGGKVSYIETDVRCSTCIDINENRGFILKAPSNIDISIVTADENNNVIKDYAWFITTTDETRFTVEDNCKFLYLNFRKKNLSAFTSESEVINSGLTVKEQNLVSVKLPVLTTVGKNVFDGKLEVGNVQSNDGAINQYTNHMRTTDFIKINANKTITISKMNNSDIDFRVEKVAYYDTNKNFIGVNGELFTFPKTVALPGKAVYIRVVFCKGAWDTTATEEEFKKLQVQIEEGSVATSYEPFKSNILTVNEDVTLRSNGSVCDELDLLTGKLTQRIDEDGEILTQEVVKTVDLMPSGTHPSTTPYCWKNGHIQLSSSGLLPNLEYSVVTSRAGQINQNATMIVKNDKRIFDLEILLAGGLVNTTYQALTLQNQVETGLSKVSLSSEKEPDYLLYHMIMKLIEEKAYKLDDLAEKVSVFYLYEKLSDEQFETIYAALYPFAEDEYFESDIPGDDEVIEEPIVDESLEEVEDEVVM